jgi:LPXTG-motif cell wall-anchored protein
MDATTIRIIAGIGAMLVLGVIIWRRNKKAAEE